MTRGSRVLIADRVMSTSLGSAEIKPTPEPLPPKYGHHLRLSHSFKLYLMGIINGIEQTSGPIPHHFE